MNRNKLESLPISPATAQLMAYEQMAKSLAPKENKNRRRLRRAIESVTRLVQSG